LALILRVHRRLRTWPYFWLYTIVAKFKRSPPMMALEGVTYDVLKQD
jgi:hypothetical protein